MRTIFAALLIILFVGEAIAQVRVQGYTRRDGTYVQPYTRSSPNRSYNDNWSVRPNVNPYTGRRGTRSPTYNDRPPARSPYGSRKSRRSGYR